MAQLITPYQKPYKWLLKRKLEILPVNELIPMGALAERNRHLSSFNERLSRSHSTIRDFCETRDIYINAGTERGIRRYRAKVVAETIVLGAKWRLTLRKEAMAVVALATKLAGNITNSPHLNTQGSSCIKAIEQELASTFSLVLLVPANYIARLNKKYQQLSMIFGQSTFLNRHDHDKGAQICVNTMDTSFNLDFDESDIDGILDSVLHYLNESSLAS